jgi:type VI secretion system protein ImpJ
MKPVKPLYWHQGLFLQPQHFQQLDTYYKSQFGPLNAYCKPWFYGVMQIKFDDDIVKTGVISVNEAEMLFPDGSWISYPDNSVILPKVLDKSNYEPHKPFTIYAGISNISISRANVTASQTTEQLMQAGVRFTADSESQECIDIHDNADSGTVARLLYIVKLFTENEKEHLGDYSLLPIARVEFDGERFERYIDFAPPSLTLGASPVLLRTARSIADQLLGASRRLDEYKIPREKITLSSSQDYFVYMLGLLIVNRYTPILYHHLASPACHPFDFFGILRQLIGELSSFTDRHGCLTDLPDGIRLLSEYDHDNCMQSYNQALEIISQLLRVLMTGPENTITFTHDQDGGFSAVIPLSTFEHSSHFYLQIRTNEKLDKILAALNNSIKIGSKDSITGLITRALPGLSLDYVQMPPPGIPRRNDTHCFRIDTFDDQWQEISKSRSMCIYWDHAPLDAFFELVVIRS